MALLCAQPCAHEFGPIELQQRRRRKAKAHPFCVEPIPRLTGEAKNMQTNIVWPKMES